MRSTHRRASLFISFIAVVLVLASVSAALAKCKDLNGDFTAILLPPPGCTSPVGICTLGTLTGGFPGTYHFTMDVLFPANDDPNNPNKLYYSGHSVITDLHGAHLFGSDTGVMFFDPLTTSPFVTTVEIVGGTGKYKHASGEFVATGQLDFRTGGAVGTYAATICKGGDDDED